MPIFIIANILFLLVITHPVTVLLHELGHAVPALVFTRHPVTVYVGSYGDPRNSLRVRLGRLTLRFRYGWFWRAGLCKANLQNQPQWVKVLFLLGGPLMSSLVAALGVYLMFHYDVHGALKLYIVAFLAMAVFDLVINLLPLSAPVSSHSGKVVYNDGYQLLLMLYQHRFYSHCTKAIELYNTQQYKKAAVLFEQFLARQLRSEEIYRLAISCHIELRNYSQALDLDIAYASSGLDLSADDYATAGYLKVQNGFHAEALYDYESALALDPHNQLALSNQGYTLNTTGQYAAAINVLNAVLDHDPTHAYAFNNRGLAKIKTGHMADGLADVNHSLALDPDNAYAYRNLGIYYLEKFQLAEAEQQLERAQALDPHTHLLPELLDYIAQLRAGAPASSPLPPPQPAEAASSGLADVNSLQQSSALAPCSAY